jgi:signal transduction histidine kinase
MILTKKLKAEILKVYNAYWEGYLKGDVKGLASLLAEEYTQVGSAETEVFSDKKGAVKFLRETIDQVAGKLEMRNRSTRIEPQGNLVLVHELCDVFVLADAEWMFYSKFRASTLMQKMNKGWMIVHQHSSFPDARTGEGENIATEKIAAENQQLHEAVKRRTVELEQKSRELEIETALERVRAIAMGMKEPADMLEVCRTISLQLQSLGVKEIRNVQTAIFYESQGTYMNYEYYAKHKKTIITETTYTNHKVHKAFATKMLKGKGEIFVTHIKGKKVKDWIAYQKTTNVFIDRLLEKSSSLNYYWHSLGPVALGISTYVPLSKEEMSLFNRFLHVFELAYTRYLDIELAHLQAREAQIEAALERIRARAMAMHTSDELRDVATILREQMGLLGQPELETCVVDLFEKDSDQILSWYAFRSPALPSGKIVTGTASFPWTSSELTREMMMMYRSGQKECTLEAEGAKGAEFFQVLVKAAPEIVHYVGESIPDKMWDHLTFFSGGALLMVSYQPPSEEAKSLQRRAASVFDMAYRRYRDLKKAEAQAREATIEASLEKVRGKAMAMHTSNDISETMGVVFTELPKLGISSLRCGVALLSRDSRTVTFYAAANALESDSLTLIGTGEMSGHPEFENQYACWLRQENYFVTLSNEDLRSYYEALTARLSAPYTPREHREQTEHGYYFPFSEGNFYAWSETPYSEGEVDILSRFKAIIDLTFRRYLDLKKAEAQAREAQIEASLERLRSKTMAMHNSADVGETVVTMFDELMKLGIKPYRCGIGIFHDAYELEAWTARTDTNGRTILVIGRLDMSRHPLLSGAYNGWKEKAGMFTYELKDESVLEYFKVVNNQPNYPVKYDLSSLPSLILHHDFYFPEGTLYVFALEPLSSETTRIFKRFASVFGQTYRRYLDLQKAEAQAREAQIEASLERVRSRTLAMQKSDELAETAAVLFRQLIVLGIEPNRLYIAILKDDNGNVEFWITDEDGSIVSSGFTANLQHNRSWRKMFDGWRDEKKSLTIDMQGEELQEYFRHLNSLNVPFKGGLSQKRRVQSIAYFSRGFLGIASPDEQPEETVTLLERFAAVFNLTLTRFNDLKLAEAQAHQARLDLIQLQAEKKRAEDALSELSATQAQLVQQEKLASLGQLTAGIAHEIKNPLNFVNNFSSLSVELVDEVMGEITKAAPNVSSGEIPHMLADIKTNLTKIIEHGSRADGIVKSMLQHSRGGSSRMEPTDLNALIKEYVNLAFHGMRAGKNPMNVDIELDFDKSVGNVLLKAEDFSRVILNLCQNAFDAMREKQNSGDGRQRSGSYLPKLTVRSRRETNKVTIQVEDNGPGIPDSIKDKVFQPFFTTKKGTQGTGLGLSITNDIVKAHGGEMKIETNGNGGATFIIALPTEIQK